ncbi:hypothetical protein PM082_005409 [Marasmius tenuissimus]|nr:hypothetical protein PM082_005409 [Marasmius tenuissimus]
MLKRRMGRMSNHSLPPKISGGLSRGPVSAHTRQAILEYLRGTEKDIESNQNEINKLKAKLLMLESKQTGLKKTTEEYRSFLAPVYKLPADTLLEIFRFCCEENEICGDKKKPPVALTLSSVSNYWRDIVISSADLWSSVSIDFQSWGNIHRWSGTALARELIVLFMERSKSVPLKIKVSFFKQPEQPSLPNNPPFGCQPVMDVLKANSYRWYKYEVFYSHFSGPSNRGPLSLPNLQHLTLCLRSPLGFDHPIIWNRFHDLPSLTSLKLDVDDTERTLHLPWEQLQSLHLDCCYSNSAFSIVSRCTNVQHLTFTNVSDADGFEAYIGERIISNTMVSMSIRGVKGSEYTTLGSAEIALIENVTIPSLESLEIVSYESPQDSDLYTIGGIDYIAQFIGRSSCSLTSLTLQSIYGITHVDVLMLLCLTPALKHLDLREHKYDTTNRIMTRNLSDRLSTRIHLNQASSDGSQQIFLPNLTELRVPVDPGY